MKYQEFRRHLGKAGMTVNQFAEFLAITATSVSNYARKESVPRSHACLAILMGDAGDRGVDFRAVLARYGMRPVREAPNVHSIEDARSAKLATKVSPLSQAEDNHGNRDAVPDGSAGD